MASSFREDSFYRRGLVLGLTMAEVIILIIFILLLTLSVFLERKDGTIEALKQEVAEGKEKVSEYQDLVETMEEIMAGESEIADLTRELVLARGDAERLKRQVAALTERNAALTEKAAALQEETAVLEAERARLAEANRNYAALEEALAEAGATTQEEVETMVGAAERLDDLEAALAAGGFAAGDPSRLKEQLAEAAAAAEALGQLGDENTTLKEQVEYFKRIAGGRSNLLPPCWIHPETRKGEYIFDVELTSRGIVVYDNALPHRRAEQAALPVQQISFERALSPGRFLAATRALFDWSEAEDCRFYVQVYDRTAADEKTLYKRLLGAVEGHFYKRLMSGSRSGS